MHENFQILQNLSAKQQSDKEIETMASQDSEPIQQLTVEIPTPGETMTGNTYATVTNHIFPYYIPPYPTDQTRVDQTTLQAMYPTDQTRVDQTTLQAMYHPETTVATNESTADSSNSSPFTPQMYILNESKFVTSSSDEESDISKESGDAKVLKNRKISESSDDLNSSSSSSRCTTSLGSPGVNQSGSSEDSGVETKSKNKSSKKKMRTNYTPGQVQALEMVFHEIPYPDAAKIESLANDLDIAETKLKIWFQNKRARWRKRTQEKPQHNFMQPIAATIPHMGPYGVIPPHHPMLHGSPAGIAQRPFFYQGYPYGMSPQSTQRLQGQPRTSGDRSMSPNQQMTPISPLTNNSLSSTSSSPTTSTTSPKSSKNGSPPSTQPLPTYHHTLSHIQPYMSFSYPYGICPPYYC